MLYLLCVIPYIKTVSILSYDYAYFIIIMIIMRAIMIMTMTMAVSLNWTLRTNTVLSTSITVAFTGSVMIICSSDMFSLLSLSFLIKVSTFKPSL